MEFEEIYKKYHPKVYRLCMGFINDEDKAKDLVQETLITVWQQLASFRNEASIGTWIYRIASNNCLRAIKTDGRIKKADMPVQIKEVKEQDKEEKIAMLYRFIAELEEADRIICGLLFEGVQQAEIASVLGISEGNTRVKIHRIKEKLSLKFKNYE